ncbi:hypothetical protein ACFQQB_50440 [Nonomuraea rubra]
MRVLVVEDERRMAAALQRGLQAEGFAVDLAHDGEEGCTRPGRATTTSWCSTSCCPGCPATTSASSCGPRRTGCRS